jgi:HSP20 family protein
MSYSLVFPSQTEDFEALLDKVLTERYGTPSNGTCQSRKRHFSTTGTSPVTKVIRPKMDVVEKDEAFIVSTELPGTRKGKFPLQACCWLCLSKMYFSSDTSTGIYLQRIFP